MRERNYGFIFWVAVIFYFCTFSSKCEEEKSRQTYVIRYKDGEQTIPVTVVLDYKKQTEYVINMNPRTPAKSVTLYDFKQRTIAYKDLTNKECFLGRLTYETLNEENNALQDVKNPVEVRPKIRSLDPRKPALTPTEIRNIAGQKTAVFCRKMNTWLLVPERGHSISKREVGEYEERSYQYHGHRSSQYSHYERETRRRFRSRNHPNTRRRSQRKEGEARNENNRLGVPEPNSLLPHAHFRSTNGIHFNPGHPDNIIAASIHNHSSNSQIPQITYLDQANSFYDRGNGRVSFTNRIPSSSLNIHEDSRYPNTESKSLSNDEIRHYPRHSLQELGSNETDGMDHEILPGHPENSSRHFRKGIVIEKLISDDTNSLNERATTTNAPHIPFERAGYPNVHSSLVHLLPLYKPLGQEFDFDQETSTKANINNHQPNQHRNVENEEHPLPRVLIEPDHSFTQLKFVHNVSHDPDVSTDVLEVPLITKEFESLKDNETYLPLPQSGNFKQRHTSVESYPLSSQKHSEHASHIQKNYLQKETVEHLTLSPSSSINGVEKETYFRGKDFHNSQSEVSTTTALPILTAREYPTAEITTSNPLYIPSVHTAFQNSEDFNTFQIFPNYNENTVSGSTERNSAANTARTSNQEEKSRVPQSLVSTTDYPLTIERHRVDINHRSDISSEGNNHASFNPVTADTYRNAHSSTPNNTVDANSPSYKIRYQSVLRDFKPDEIVIDIENIPTHTPAPFTSRFQQRPFTTIQPIIKTVSSNDIKNDTNRRSEQISGTTWRSLYSTTTKYPRRRISDKTRRPIQNSSVSFTQRNSLSHNRYQAPKPPSRINQFVGVGHFNPTHRTNRRQFHYPSRPIPPSRVIVPSEANHHHHFSHLNNLPPGVSVHPRHPQAPFADMVRSNRPPTIPFVNDNQVFVKPHRERHHRKKEMHLNSCCRLRGQTGAFQSCCRNGGSCCSRSRRRMQPPGSPCCSSIQSIGQIMPSKQLQTPVRITNQTLPPIRTEKTHRSEADNKDRCQKEKMCRTLYESTQQVMVCRNAHIEGC